MVLMRQGLNRGWRYTRPFGRLMRALLALMRSLAPRSIRCAGYPAGGDSVDGGVAETLETRDAPLRTLMFGQSFCKSHASAGPGV